MEFRWRLGQKAQRHFLGGGGFPAFICTPEATLVCRATDPNYSTYRVTTVGRRIIRGAPNKTDGELRSRCSRGLQGDGQSCRSGAKSSSPAASRLARSSSSSGTGGARPLPPLPPPRYQFGSLLRGGLPSMPPALAAKVTRGGHFGAAFASGHSNVAPADVRRLCSFNYYHYSWCFLETPGFVASFLRHIMKRGRPAFCGRRSHVCCGLG